MLEGRKKGSPRQGHVNDNGDGLMSTSKQDLRRLVGIMSRSQEVSEEDMIILLTSSSVDGAKDESRGGGVIGDWSVGGIAGGGSFEHKSDLTSKFFRKEAARVDAHGKEGKHDGMLRERREFKVDQSLRG